MRDHIETGRLVLRRFERADCPRLIELAGDLRVSRNLSRMPHPYTQADADQWIAHQDTMWREHPDRVWAVAEADGGLAGAVGVHWQNRHSDDDSYGWELGYWFGTPFWGRGYATEAAGAALAELEAAHGRVDIVAGYATDNPSSGHVLEKLGFHKTGVIRDFDFLARGGPAPLVQMRRPATAAGREGPP